MSALTKKERLILLEELAATVAKAANIARALEADAAKLFDGLPLYAHQETLEALDLISNDARVDHASGRITIMHMATQALPDDDGETCGSEVEFRARRLICSRKRGHDGNHSAEYAGTEWESDAPPTAFGTFLAKAGYR